MLYIYLTWWGENPDTSKGRSYIINIIILHSIQHFCITGMKTCWCFGGLKNGTTWIPTGEIESSSGRFTVEILSPDPSYMTNNMPSTSGGQKHEALSDADSRVEVSCVIERKVSMDKIVFLFRSPGLMNFRMKNERRSMQEKMRRYRPSK